MSHNIQLGARVRHNLTGAQGVVTKWLPLDGLYEVTWLDGGESFEDRPSLEEAPWPEDVWLEVKPTWQDSAVTWAAVMGAASALFILAHVLLYVFGVDK